MRFRQPYAILCLVFMGLTAMRGNARASIILNFFPVSDFNANTAAMDATLGLTGYTVDNFESTALLPGLTIDLSGGVTSTTLTSLATLFNENSCVGLTQNAAWDGTDTVVNIPTNSLSNCNTPANIAKFITFNYAPGTTSLGVGMGNFQSLGNGPIPITNHELFVNGVDKGVIETLAGANWTPGLMRNAYVRIDATGGDSITSVEFENISASDVLMFDHLAALQAETAVPEPRIQCLVLGGLIAVALLRRYSAA